MKKLLMASALAAGTLLAACGTPNQTASSTCQAVATAEANPTVMAQINSLDPTSAQAVTWKYVSSGCINGSLAAGVDETWEAAALDAFKAALPIVLPLLVGLI
jgi:uncharacterized lipoprotein YajG